MSDHGKYQASYDEYRTEARAALERVKRMNMERAQMRDLLSEFMLLANETNGHLAPEYACVRLRILGTRARALLRED